MGTLRGSATLRGSHFESREFSHGILSVFRGGFSHGFLARRAGRNVGTLYFFVPAECIGGTVIPREEIPDIQRAIFRVGEY